MLSSTSVVGFQSASSMLNNHGDISVTGSRIRSKHVMSSMELEHASVTCQNDEDISKMDHVMLFGQSNIKHFCYNENNSHTSPPSSSSCHAHHQERMGYSSERVDVGDSKHNPLVIDDSSIEVSHDQSKGSHDHHEASHAHNEVSHDHNEASHDHNEVSHDAHMRHNNKHDKQKVANLVVCVLNPYLKKGRIANKV